jgi:transposase InsO family protein
VEAEILVARATWRYGPDRLGPLLGRPASTVHRVLARRGLSRMRDADRVTTAPIRYVACHPGALLHQDHKKLGRIPDGGGWRVNGRDRRDRGGAHGKVGYDHLEVLVDDTSRYAVVVRVPDETAASAAHALEAAAAEFASLGIRIERVLTDNGPSYVSHAFNGAIASLGARHKRTRRYRPQTNGKAERLIRTLLDEWAYGRTYRSNSDRAAALPVFLDFYNRSRPHTALGGRSPLDVVNNVRGDHS